MVTFSFTHSTIYEIVFRLTVEEKAVFWFFSDEKMREKKSLEFFLTLLSWNKVKQERGKTKKA